jgi:hypothetical protein
MWLRTFFDSKVENLLNLYAVTSKVDHPGEKGIFRELVLRNLLIYLLPPHFGVGTGVIVDAWGNQSRQTDLIIFDKRRLPPFLLEESRGIFPIDAVLRAIEVKSCLSKSDIQDTIQAAFLLSPRNPKGLRMATEGTLKDGQSNYPFSAIFAYDSDWKISDESLPAAYKGDDSNLRAICVAKKSFVALPKRGLGILPTSAEAVRGFMACVLGALESDAESRKEFSVIEWLFR